jgi:hypothetical protein
LNTLKTSSTCQRTRRSSQPSPALIGYAPGESRH